jgi:hypothetical protein
MTALPGSACRAGWVIARKDGRETIMVKMLSGARLAKLVTPAGFTLHPVTGYAPASGYMVSLPGHTHTYPESVAQDQQALASALDATLASERDSFDQPDTYLGGWISDGMLWLDPSQNVADYADAVSLASERDQVAIWDVAGQTEVGTGGTGGTVVSHS